jgi:hypothetical protein
MQNIIIIVKIKYEFYKYKKSRFIKTCPSHHLNIIYEN